MAWTRRSVPLITYRILGPLAVERDGQPLDVGGPKQRALLLSLLLRRGQVVPADRLVDDAWGERPPRQASASLHASISHLRRVLEPERPPDAAPRVLVRRPGGYSLAVSPDAIDAVRFQAHIDAGRQAAAAGDPVRAGRELCAALELWRGRPLADLADEPFAVAEVARLEEMRLAALEESAVAALALGRHSAVVPDLEALVAEHPLRERLRGLLILALYRAGRQADALARYREGRERLADELGIDPGRELRRLEEQILRQDPVLDWRSTTNEPAPAPVGDGQGRPLVGRGDELRRLGEAWTAARSGSGRIVLIAGEAGIGKSRLVETLAQHVADDGGDVRWGRCFQTEGSPAFWAWVQVLRGVVDDARTDALVRATAGLAADLAQIVPDLKERLPHAGTPAAAEPVEARFRLLDATIRFLTRIAAERPMLVVLEDVHWADAASLDVLRLLAAGVTRTHLLVVATYRDTVAERGAPLSAALPALVREAGVARVSLRGLARDGLAQLAASALDDEVPATLVTALHERTEGNPFYATQLLSLVEAGTALPAEVPAGVREVIQRRVEGLPDVARAMLEAAAVVGRDFVVPTLATATRTGPDEVLEALDTAVAAGVVGTTDDPERYRFAHALVRDALYETLPPGRRTRLHAAVGEALEGDEARAAEVAHHFERAAALGFGDRAFAASLRAAEHAERVHAFETVEAHLRQALRVAGDDPVRELGIQARLATLLLMTQGYTGAGVRAAAHRLRELAGRTGETGQADLVRWALWVDACVSADFTTAQAIAEEHLADARRGGDLAGLATGLQIVATTCWHLGRHAQAEEHFAAALAIIEGLDGEALLVPPMPNVVITGLIHSSCTLFALGRIEEGRQRLERALADAAGLGAFHVTFAEDAWSFWGLLTHDVTLRRFGERGLERAEEHGFPQLAALLQLQLGWYQAVGEGDNAGIARIEAGFDAMRAHGMSMLQPLYLCFLGEALEAVGRDRDAEHAYDAGIASADASGEHMHLAELCRRRGLLARRVGEHGDAWLRRALDVASAQGATLFAARAEKALAG